MMVWLKMAKENCTVLRSYKYVHVRGVPVVSTIIKVCCTEVTGVSDDDRPPTSEGGYSSQSLEVEAATSCQEL